MHPVNEAAVNAQYPVMPFITDSNRAETENMAPIRPGLIHPVTDTTGNSRLQPNHSPQNQ